MKLYIKTIGCKTNYFDSISLMEDLYKYGFSMTDNPEDADVMVVNSCVVTHRAEADVRKSLRKLRKQNPGGKIVLTGCGVKMEGGKPFKGMADFLLPPKAKEMAERVAGIKLPEKKRGLEEEEKRGRLVRVRRYLKIQDGCDLSCSYCIVPLVRGKNRSFEKEQILEEVTRLEKEGVREIVITGIHIGHYGRDLRNGVRLSRLLKEMISSTKRVRYRLSSIEVDEIDEELMELIIDGKRLCRHIHVPLQSGDDEILRAMNRWYSTKDFRALVEKVKTLAPDTCVGTDVITGFPGETDARFLNTLKFIEDTPIDYLHVFSFSPRKGTRAFDMEGRVPSSVVKERTGALIEVGKRKKREFLSSFLGEEKDVVVEKAYPGFFEGTSDNYITVKGKGEGIPGELARVKILEVDGERCRGLRI